VAEWAGHSVNVLLRVYGQDDVARHRIEAALLAGRRPATRSATGADTNTTQPVGTDGPKPD
jgi:hypothetical protein